MKRLLLAIAFAAAPLVFGSDAPQVARVQVANIENQINGALAAMYPDERYFILAPARGIYIDNFGLVFMAEVNLVSGPAITPFHQEMSKEEIARHRDRKLSRLPRLRSELLKVLGNTITMIQAPPGAGQCRSRYHLGALSVGEYGGHSFANRSAGSMEPTCRSAKERRIARFSSPRVRVLTFHASRRNSHSAEPAYS